MLRWLYLDYFWQEKEDPEMAMELRKMSIDYERRRMQLQVYFGNFLILCVKLVSFIPSF